MAAHPTELEAEESEAAPSGQVDGPTLLLVDRDLQSGQFLPESSVNGLQQPVMPAVGRGGPRNSDRLLRWDPDHREGVWNVPKETELPG